LVVSERKLTKSGAVPEVGEAAKEMACVFDVCANTTGGRESIANPTPAKVIFLSIVIDPTRISRASPIDKCGGKRRAKPV